MRLVCPNCDAEYEVDAAAIPLPGRDVQCSNCGHAWFQAHPELEAAEEARLDQLQVAEPVREVVAELATVPAMEAGTGTGTGTGTGDLAEGPVTVP